MLRIIRVADNAVISITEAVGDEDAAYLSVDDVMVRLFDLQSIGTIRIEPGAEALQRMAVRSGILTYFARDKAEDGIRRYASDRRGGRINRTAARIHELDAVHRREAILSIQQFMNVEGPAAYRSQAQLLGILDPTVSADLVAQQAIRAVDEAIREGIEQGRETTLPNESAV